MSHFLHNNGSTFDLGILEFERWGKKMDCKAAYKTVPVSTDPLSASGEQQILVFALLALLLVFAFGALSLQNLEFSHSRSPLSNKARKPAQIKPGKSGAETGAETVVQARVVTV